MTTQLKFLIFNTDSHFVCTFVRLWDSEDEIRDNFDDLSIRLNGNQDI